MPIAKRIICFEALVKGHEYAETHNALMNLYRRFGQSSLARDEAVWLQKHRSLTLVELHNQPMLIPNILALRIAASIVKRAGALTVRQRPRPAPVISVISP